MLVHIWFRLVNITCHILLLSLVEPFFTFAFVSALEHQEHERKMKMLDEHVKKIIDTINLTPTQQLIIRNAAQNVHQKSVEATKKRGEYNQTLIYRSIFIVFGILVVLLIFSLIAIHYHTQIPWRSIFVDKTFILFSIKSSSMLLGIFGILNIYDLQSL